jgi:hypothetical protein
LSVWELNFAFKNRPPARETRTRSIRNPACPKTAGSPLKRYAPFKKAAAKGLPGSSSRDVCHLKIFGVTKDPFLLELVPIKKNPSRSYFTDKISIRLKISF